MDSASMNFYKLKRRLLSPYIWCMRHKERHTTGFHKAVLEQLNYSPAFYRFVKAYTENPDILIDAPAIGGESVVFDVGAFDGDWSARVFEKYQPRICCFEVEPNQSKSIAQRFQSNPKIRCFDFGLSGANATLWLTSDGMGSTLYLTRAMLLKSGDASDLCRVQVTVRDIVEVMDDMELKQIDLLKLNIEGSEYDLLERMIDTSRIQDVACLMVQFHEWIDGAYKRRREIRRALTKTHTVAWEYPFCWEQWIRK